ncbi:MAG: NAD(P)H-dependent oxidoreductase [bacterium]|nr:NAD(P)H-dependent oxidoreductase [bacterium]
MSIQLLAFCASTRKESFNRKLFSIVVAGARQTGTEVTIVDLNDYPMPIYNGDDETATGMPESAVKLLEILSAHQGLLVVTPEYNGFFPPLLKNTLDWMSRPDPSGQSSLRHFQGRIAAIASASPSGFGGVRSLLATRQYLTILGLTVIPDQVTVSQAHKAFAENGELADARLQAAATALGATLAAVTARLAS